MTWDGDLTIPALRESYANGATTPSQVVEAVLRRVGEYAQKDPAVWIDIVSASDALARAKELEQAYEGEEKPRLFGVPFSVKNSIDVRAFKTTVACPSFAYTAQETAPVVQRCLDEGAILIGTTNLEQFATVRSTAAVFLFFLSLCAPALTFSATFEPNTAGPDRAS
jgi:allophanate hydrolase